MPTNSPKSSGIPYRETFDAAIQELADLMSEREELDSKRDGLDARIYKLREAIVGLGGLCNQSAEVIAATRPELFPDSSTPDVGFTDAIRAVFKANREHYHSPVWIRDALEADGFDVDKYKNVLASIHSILKRLKAKNEILEGNREGRTVYRFNPKGPLAAADLSDDDIPF
jgi:hypothetical protein